MSASGTTGPPTWTTVPTTGTPGLPASWLMSPVAAQYDGLTNRLIVCDVVAGGRRGRPDERKRPRRPRDLDHASRGTASRRDAATAFDPSTRSLFLYGGYNVLHTATLTGTLWVLRDADGLR